MTASNSNPFALQYMTASCNRSPSLHVQSIILSPDCCRLIRNWNSSVFGSPSFGYSAVFNVPSKSTAYISFMCLLSPPAPPAGGNLWLIVTVIHYWCCNFLTLFVGSTANSPVSSSHTVTVSARYSFSNTIPMRSFSSPIRMHFTYSPL